MSPRRPLRVAVVCDWFLKYAGGQVAGLHAAGVEVSLVCRTHAHEFGGSVDERDRLLRPLRERGITVVEVPGRVGDLRSVGDVRRALRAVRRARPDVLHFHTNQDPRFLALAATHRPSVLTVHDPAPHPGAPAVDLARRAVRRAWLTAADALVVHGAELLRDLELPRRGGRPVAVIPHGTAPASRPLPVPVRPTVVLFGRLAPYKGVAVLMRAMEILWRRRPDVRVVVAGDGPAGADVIDHPCVQRREGHLPEAEVERLLAEATVLVLPYTQASQSGVGLLGVGRGIPCVVSAVGSLADLALEPSMVVSPDDPPALAEALLRWLDHDQAQRAAILADADRRFSWRAVAEQSIAFYRGLLERP